LATVRSSADEGGAPASGFGSGNTLFERRAHPDDRDAFRASHPRPVELTGRDGPKLRGSALARGILRAFGWRVRFDGLPSAQGVAIAYPHTSNWDFVVGILAKWAMGLPLTFWGKDALFRVPLFGAWLRWLGGIPVDRGSPQGIVGDMATRLRVAREDGEFMWLALAPEGTRSRVPGWRSGFYQVTLQADVPLGLAFFDYEKREIGFDSFWQLSGDRALDMGVIAARLEGKHGRRPDQASPIRFL
jgi:hypothetical protein